MEKIQEIISYAQGKGPMTIAVASAEDRDVLLAVDRARELGIARGILVGDKEKIEEVAKDTNINLTDYEIIHKENMQDASSEAVKLVSSGKAHILMKGLVDTAVILKEALNADYGLREGKLLSHVAVFEPHNYDKLLLMTDAAMNIAPDLEKKKEIIKNSIKVAKALEVDTPNVCVICAKEKVSPKMEATLHAKELERLNREGQIKDCVVGGPFGLDNAISKEAAIHKGIEHPLAGVADILLMSNIEAGNVFYKTMVFLAKDKNAGVIVGASAPIVLTSRADNDEAKLNSIALSVLMAIKKEEGSI
ncbi:MAG: phosphate butyryltransferase [Anaeromicrobium sp.]|jgi:phosphate butyryltransferase|uniref:phosphate butyryltransferase n=1 Tax=Anaeromicrobium sp. TaxID=1929132 RepID=UPI0025E1C776|nr:phosphate butyryltransferase [Anaeromicrobium sp.]MCT4594608.1 phosphate butyryltransferase [Anaeromicrobium sp.]